MPQGILAVRGTALMTGKIANWLGYGFKTFVLRKELPYLFGLVITDKCNLDCFYCESKNSGLYHFTYSEALRVIKEAYERGHRSLYFTGGEPMVWEDGGHSLSELVDYAGKLGFLEIFIFTNGTIPLTLKGCKYIVTVDGPKEVHDSIRSKTYDLVIKNARESVTESVFASITFSKANAQYLDEFVKETAALGIFKGISFNFLTHCPEIVEEHGLVQKEKEILLERIWELKKQGYPIVLSRAAYKALLKNNWKRPIPQIELGTNKKIFTCCRDIDNPSVCDNCGYVNCVEISQILALKPSAMMQVMKMIRS